MKIAVIYYSYEGNTKLIAENIAETAGAELLELKPKKEMKSKGFLKYFRGAKSVILKAKPELVSIGKDFEEYDILFIGTPVWAQTYAPPLNTFFSTHSLSNKRIGLFCCHAGVKGKIFDKMKEALQNNQIVGEIDFRDPIKIETEKNIQKARDWTESIIKVL